MATETTQEQCHAITEDGQRCERPAREDGFCYQHDESDETVDDEESSTEAGTSQSGSVSADGQSSDGADGSSNTDDGERTAEMPDSLDGVRDVRSVVEALAPQIIGRKLDAIIEIGRRDDDWQAVVEVVERPAVPDTQDILGRYEIDLADGNVTGYRRVDRYRRNDTSPDEPR